MAVFRSFDGDDQGDARSNSAGGHLGDANRRR